MLWRKMRDAASAVPMPGTEGGVAPFFSPDGRWVGFQTLDRKLRKIPVDGGGAVTLAENGSFNYKVGVWLDDQTIVYGVGLTEVARVSADGGEPVMLPMPGAVSGVNLLSIVALPGSRGFLAALCDGNCSVNSAVYVYEFAADSARLLVPNASGVWYAPTGHLLFTDRERGLFAAPFDLKNMEVTGGAVSVIEGVEPTRFALSASGTAVYVVDRTAEAPSDLVWVSRDGQVEPVDSAWRGWFEYPAISPDGRSVAVSLRGRTTDLWIRREDGTRQKLIAAGDAIWRPSWTPDGESLAFIAVTTEQGPGQARAFLARADGVGTARQLVTHDSRSPRGGPRRPLPHRARARPGRHGHRLPGRGPQAQAPGRVKVLKPELGAVLGAERFINEIRTTANLQHPNLLPLFDSGEADGLLFYVMPFVEGRRCGRGIDAERQLPVDETVRLISLLAGALDFAHARGVVHRDLKPENILLQAGQPIIADFGIALAVAEAGGERVTQTGLSLGTPHYMSPEQAAGTHTVDARSDQYALGATAYEMLTGEPPHTGPTTSAIVARLLTEKPRDIRATRPAVPAGVDAAILRALEKSPADRFPSCGAFAGALARGRHRCA
jgi:hypothetical protein